MQGDHIGTMEATETFFAMTKLFQSSDVSSTINKDILTGSSCHTKLKHLCKQYHVVATAVKAFIHGTLTVFVF